MKKLWTDFDSTKRRMVKIDLGPHDFNLKLACIHKFHLNLAERQDKQTETVFNLTETEYKPACKF